MIDLPMDLLWGLIELVLWRRSKDKADRIALDDGPRSALRAKHESLP